MRHLILATLLLAPVAAYAQQPQPITLSPDEYTAIMQALLQRDPIAAALMHKQAEAQQAAKTTPPKDDHSTPDTK